MQGASRELLLFKEAFTFRYSSLDHLSGLKAANDGVCQNFSRQAITIGVNILTRVKNNSWEKQEHYGIIVRIKIRE